MRHLYPTFIFFLIFGIQLSASAQGALYENIERFGFSSGATIYFIKDELISPVVYNGTTVPFGINYEKTSGISSFHAGITFDKSTLSSDVTEVNEFTDRLLGHYSEYWAVNFYGHFLSKIFGGDFNRVLLGGRLHGLGVYRLHTIFEQLPWDTGYGFLNFQVATQLQQILFNQHWLDFTLAYGIGAFSMGHQYSRVFTGSEWQWLGAFHNIESRISYNLPWTDKLDSGVEYRFNYQEFNKDLPYQLANHQILVSLNYRF